MKIIKSIIFPALLILAGCTDEPCIDKSETTDKSGEIECIAEGQQSALSRTYYDCESNGNTFWGKWDKNDRIAICFDHSATARQFNLLNGENSANATFHGPMPDSYSNIQAVYPFDIYQGHTSSAININLSSQIKYDSDKKLYGAMPMYAQGTGTTLNFYNLMGVIKISLRGKGLLRSITIRSGDNRGLSGPGRIVLDENNIPSLSIDDNGSDLTVNMGSVFLSDQPLEILLPIPAATYNNGLKFEFLFEGQTETRELAGPLHFDRSVLRAVKPYKIEVPFYFDSYQPHDNEIWYKSTYHQGLIKETDLGSPVISHSYSSTKKMGVITTESAIMKIGGPIFDSPDLVTFIKLPRTVQEIAMNGMSKTAIESFEAPECLKTLGTDAFLGCNKLKRVVLNNGLESIGAEAFGDCSVLAYVYIPKTVSMIAAYSFRHSTLHLDQWHGDCPLIDADRHTLYSNNSYGSISDTYETIDVIAGCDLLQYEIPHQALYMQNYALAGCQKLKKLIIHENFRSFGSQELSSLTNLETIVSYAKTPPSFDPQGNFVLKSLKKIKVPKSSIMLYKTADGWKRFSDKIVAL